MALKVGSRIALLGSVASLPLWLSQDDRNSVLSVNFKTGQVWDGTKKKPRQLTDIFSNSRGSTAYVDDSQGNWTAVPPNTLRVSDKGLLTEPAQTNSIRNNSMQGAVPSVLQNGIRNNTMVGAVAGQSQNAIRNNSMQGAVVGQSQNAIRNNTMQGAVLGQSQNTIRNNSMVGAVAGQSQNAIRNNAMIGASGPTSSNMIRNNTMQGAVLGQAQNAIRNNSMQGATAFVNQNMIRNNMMAGAVVGTPGTLPTNWGIAVAAGLTTQVISTSTVNGIDTIRIRVSGTTTASGQINISFETGTGVAAVSGQTWTHSVYTALAAGSLTNTAFQVDMDEYGTGGFLVGGSAAVTPGGSLTRTAYTRTLSNASTTYVRPILYSAVASGVTIDVTLDIGNPQLEQSSTAGTVTKTSGNAVTGTPSTLPSNGWSVATVSGINYQVVGVGSDSGIDYIDIRFNGTATAAGGLSVLPEASGIVAAANGQTWTCSTYRALVGGSTANLGAWDLFINELTNVGNYINGTSTPLPAPTNAVLNTQRASGTRTFNGGATVAYTNFYHRVMVANGAVVDFTIRIGSPQLEQAPSAGPVTRTTGTAASATSGTLPTNWSLSLTTGLSQQVVGLGNESGIDYVDVRIVGIASGGSAPTIFFDGPQIIAATTGQTWTISDYLRLMAGSIPSTGLARTGFEERNSSGAYLTDSPAPGITPTNAALSTQRATRTVTTSNANTAFVRPYVWFPSANTGSVDFTIRVGNPQLEQSATASPVVKTNGTAVPVSSSGNYPNYWTGTLSSTGITQQIVGSGSISGLDYVDIRVVGTASTGVVSLLYFDNSVNAVSATTGQAWTQSAYLGLVAGSFANVTTMDVTLRENDSGSAFLRQTTTSFLAATSTLTRYTDTITTGASTTGLASGIRWTANSGAVVDFTIRIASPQLEQAPGAGPVTRTTGTAAAQVQGTVPNFQNFSGNVNGINRTIVGTGTVNGLDYIDVRYTGVATANGNFAYKPEVITATNAVNGQTWNLSIYVALIAGSLSGLGTSQSIDQYNSSGTYTSGMGGGNVTATGTLTRLSMAATLNNTATATIQPAYYFLFTTGQSVDVTLRFASPQLEQAPGAGPVTRTTGMAAAWSQGTLPTNWQLDTTSTQIRQVAGIGTENGVDYVDIRVFTQVNNDRTYYAIFPETTNGSGISGAAAGQIWTYSESIKQISTSTTYATTIITRPAGTSDIASVITIPAVTTTLDQDRQKVTGTIGSGATGGLTAFTQISNLTTTAPIDIIIRIGNPQLEQSSFAGPVTKTTGTAVAYSQGTLPTNWAAGITGTLSYQVVGTGVENGIDYVDLRTFGVTNAVNASLTFIFEQTTLTPATIGQTWTSSVYSKLLSGSYPGQANIIVLENNSGGVQVNNSGSSLTNATGTTLDQRRWSVTRTFTGSTTAATSSSVYFQAPTSGTAVDFTVRLGLPQLEQSSVPGPVSRTTGTAIAYSAGTLPNNWTVPTVANTACQVVGVGSINGISYSDIRLYGTAPINSEIIFDSVQPSANIGQTWTGSAYLSLVGGSLSNVSSFQIRTLEQGGTNPSTSTAVALTSNVVSSQRYTATKTLTDSNSTTVRVRLPFQTTGTFDFTVRVGSPQLEPNATAGTVVNTSGYAAWTPGTFPNYWTVNLSGSGLSRQVVGTGVQNGVEYMDFRIFGTPSNTGPLVFGYEQGAFVTAALNQLWTGSQFVALVGGSLSGVTLVSTSMYETNNVGGYLTEGGTTFTPTSTLTRQYYSRTLTNASTVNVWHGLRIAITSGSAIDFTIRVGWPQLEQWNPAISTVGGPSSPIRTTNGVATRAADIITAVDPVGSSIPISIAGIYRNNISMTNSNAMIRAGDGPSSGYRILVNNNNSYSAGDTGGTNVTDPTIVAVGTRLSYAFSGDTTGQSASVNGSTPTTIVNGIGATHTGMLSVGSNGDGGGAVFGYHERLVIFNYRVPDAYLNVLSTLQNWGG